MMQHFAYEMPAQNNMGYMQQLYYDDFHMPQPTGRRLSRGSAVQRAGTTMRIMKPASANNSPRSSIMAARRRTMMNESYNARRQQQVLDYVNTTQGMAAPRAEAASRQSRPLSWHPSSHLYATHGHFQSTPGTNPLSTPNFYADYQDMYLGNGPHFSPTAESYSADTSPASTFSPLPAAFPSLENDQYFGTAGWETNQKSNMLYAPAGNAEMFPPSLSSSMESGQTQMNNNVDWNTFIMHGFSRTSPPTPETFLQLPQQHQQALVQEREPVFPQVETAEEEEGEILVGMGLYDNPDKHAEDPQLNNYRSTVSSLLGSSFHQREPQGKGLKLEETWEPPKSDDEEEDDDDAEGEDEAAGTA